MRHFYRSQTPPAEVIAAADTFFAELGFTPVTTTARTRAFTGPLGAIKLSVRAEGGQVERGAKGAGGGHIQDVGPQLGILCVGGKRGGFCGGDLVWVQAQEPDAPVKAVSQGFGTEHRSQPQERCAGQQGGEDKQEPLAEPRGEASGVGWGRCQEGPGADAGRRHGDPATVEHRKVFEDPFLSQEPEPQRQPTDQRCRQEDPGDPAHLCRARATGRRRRRLFGRSGGWGRRRVDHQETDGARGS